MLFYENFIRRLRSLSSGLITLTFLVLAGSSAFADAGDEGRGQEFIDRYMGALASQSDAQKGVTMDVMLDARIPKLKKEGRMSLLRMVSRLGQITYKPISFWGDNTVKKEVIARYLEAEQTQAKGGTGTGKSVSITPENYQFKYKGLQERGDQRRVHVFELKPKEKRVGLFKGELWLDPETCLPVREFGKLVKNPSIFLKKVEFVREYEISEGVARLKHFESVIDTRIAGKAELAVDFSNYRPAESQPVDAAQVTTTQ